MQRNELPLDEQKQAADLTYNQLYDLWKAARRNDFSEFCGYFKNGNLVKGLDAIENDHIILCEKLHLAAKTGNYQEFERLFKKGIVNVNEQYQGKTFLYTVIKNDNQKENDPETQGRIKIAKLLLQHQADIYLNSFNLTGIKPSPWEMCLHFRNQSKNTWQNTLSALLFSQPMFGKNIFPLVEEHHEKLQRPLQHHVIHIST